MTQYPQRVTSIPSKWAPDSSGLRRKPTAVKCPIWYGPKAVREMKK